MTCRSHNERASRQTTLITRWILPTRGRMTAEGAEGQAVTKTGAPRRLRPDRSVAAPLTSGTAIGRACS